MNVLRKWWGEFWGNVAAVEQESRRAQASADPAKVNWRLVLVVVVGCVCLAILEYYGASGDYKILRPVVGLFHDHPRRFMREVFRRGDRAELFRLAYWSITTFIFYFIVPAVMVKLFLKESLRDFGLRTRGILKHAWIYAAMYFAVIPFVVAVAFTEPFQKTYPFYGNAGASLVDFLAWEALYILQFFSLEFFFRGFLIHGTRARFGYYSIFLSVVPYCMIHFGKPLPETLGAVVAGLALGTISLFTRSIWLGVMIHVSVAVSMDLLSLGIKGDLF